MKSFTFKNGDQMPLLGLGTWKAVAGEVYGAVREAIKIGYRHIDCAFLYNNEAEIGLAIKDAISDGEVTREELWITSKLWNNSHGKNNVIPALKRTLADLQLDHLDLYLIHWPIPLKENLLFPRSADDFYSLDEKPIANTWEGMEEAVELGLTKHIGVSNFGAKKLRDLIGNSKIKPEVNQVEMHPYLQQNELYEFCKKEEILLTAYSPLGTGSIDNNPQIASDMVLLNSSLISEIANNINKTTAQVCIAWAIKRGTAVIPKSVNPERLAQNFAAAGINLSSTNMERIELIDKNHRYVDGEFWAVQGSGYTIENIWE